MLIDETKDSKTDSSTGNAQDSATHQRKDDVNPGRDVESLIAENKRKSEKIVKLEKEMTTISDRLIQLEEISKERDLTKSEQKNYDQLKGDINDRFALIEKGDDPAVKTWRDWITDKSSKLSEKAAIMAIQDLEIRESNSFIREKAMDEGVDEKELAEKIKPYFKFDPNYTYAECSKNAFREYKKQTSEQNKLRDELKKLREERDSELRFRETGSRLPRETAQDEKFEKASTPQQRQGIIVDLLDQIPSSGH